MKKSLFIISVAMILLAVFLNSCSSELNGDNMQDTSLYSGLEGLNFKINVSSYQMSDTRAQPHKSDTMKTWRNNDNIYMIIDGDKNNLAKLTYSETTKSWSISNIKQGILTSFGQSGKITAVYADTLNFVSVDSIRTMRDILYTKEGVYSRDGNSVLINLNMNVRPVTKLRIVGSDKNFVRIDGFKEFTTLNLETMEWRNGKKNGIENYWPYYAKDTIAYFGIIEPDEGGDKTTIKLLSENGLSYKTRTLEKVFQPNTWVDIEGPSSKDASKKALWESKITSIPQAKATDFVTAYASGGLANNLKSFNITYLPTSVFWEYEIPKLDNTADAQKAISKFETSDENVVSLARTGSGTGANNATINGIGSAKITLTSVDGYSTSFNFIVRDISEFVRVVWADSCWAATKDMPFTANIAITNKFNDIQFVSGAINIEPVAVKLRYAWNVESNVIQYKDLANVTITSNLAKGKTSYARIQLPDPTLMNNSTLIFTYKYNNKEYTIEAPAQSYCSYDENGKLVITHL